MLNNVQIRTVGTQANIAVIQIRGALDTPLAYDLERKSSMLIKSGISKCIINLEHIEYISSAGIEFFQGLAYKLRQNHGDVIFTQVPAKIYKLFEMVGLTAVFQIKNSLAEAIGELEPF
jgi:anti-sigma B factor antagonist